MSSTFNERPTLAISEHPMGQKEVIFEIGRTEDRILQMIVRMFSTNDFLRVENQVFQLGYFVSDFDPSTNRRNSTIDYRIRAPTNRSAVFQLVLSSIRLLVNDIKPFKIQRIAASAEIPERGLVKYHLISELMEELGFDTVEQVAHGKNSWMHTRRV